MYSKKINQLATNLNPQETDLIPIGDAETGQLKTTTFNAISGITGDGIISGGIVTWTGTGLNFNISACTYILNGVRYSSPFSTKTLAAADPTNPRIDVFAVNTSGQVEVIQGTPNANPVEPEGDTPTTLGLTNVTINAGATTPNGVTKDMIYDENVETWTKTESVTGSFNYNDTAFPYTGSKALLVTMSAGFADFRFSKATAMDITTYKSLSFAIRLNAAWTGNTALAIQFYNGTRLITNTYQITATNTVGFNRNLAGTYQIVTIPLNGTLLRFSQNTFTAVRIYTFNAAATYRLDTISLNGGINNPGGTTSANSFGFVNGSTGSAASTQATDTLNVVGTGLATTSATGKTLTISVPDPIPSQTGNNGKYLTTDGSVLSWGTVSGGASIGGTVTGGTTGSVLFVGTSSALAQDNANFFWDDTNNRLGIGTNLPTYTLDVNGTARVQNNVTVRRDVNGTTALSVENTTNGTASVAVIGVTSDGSAALNLGKYSTTTNATKIIEARDGYIYNITAGDIAILNDVATGKIKFASGGVSTAQMTLTAAGRLLLGTTNESTYILDVNGTGRFQDNLLISKNQNATTQIEISNTTSGTNATTECRITSDATTGSFVFGKHSAAKTAFKIIAAKDSFITNTVTAGDIAILNNFATGTIKLAAGGSSTAQATLTAAGRLLLGTTTESTFLLDVNGEGRFANTVTINSATGLFRGSSLKTTGPLLELNSTSNYGHVGTTGSTSFYLGTGSVSGTTTTKALEWNTSGDIFNNIFKIDFVNKRFGLGTTSPTTTLDIIGEDNPFLVTTYGGANPGLITRKANGTSASPTQATSDQFLCYLGARGYHSGGAFSGNTGLIAIKSAEAYTSTAQGSYITFENTPTGSTTRAERARITAAGRLLLGTTTESTFLLDVNGTARVTDTLTVGTNTFTNKLNASFGTIGIQSFAVNNSWFGDNVFYNGSAFVRRSAGFAGLFYFAGSEGQFRWGTSSTANSTITNGASGSGLISFKMNVDGSIAMGNLLTAVGDYTGSTFLLFGSSNNIGINTTSDVSSAQLHISSTTKGFLPPRMTTTQKNAIATPAAGLVVYDTTLNQMSYYNGTTWINF